MPNLFLEEEQQYNPKLNIRGYRGMSGWLIKHEIVKTYKGASILLSLILILLIGITIVIIDKSKNSVYLGPTDSKYIDPDGVRGSTHK